MSSIQEERLSPPGESVTIEFTFCLIPVLLLLSVRETRSRSVVRMSEAWDDYLDERAAHRCPTCLPWLTLPLSRCTDLSDTMC